MNATSHATYAAGTKLGNDRELIARARQGEEAAFAALFGAHKRRVYSLCLRFTRSAADAEDLTQEAFLKVFRKISSFRGDSTFSTWLHRLVVNELLMHLRKKRVPQVPLEAEINSRDETVKRERGQSDGRLTGCIDRIALRRAIAQLPAGYRVAFLLYDVQGYKHTEIADMMNWSLGNSKSQVFKARRKLRVLLGMARWKGTARPRLAEAV